MSKSSNFNYIVGKNIMKIDNTAQKIRYQRRCIPMKDGSAPGPEENGQHEAYDNIFIPPPINGSQKKEQRRQI